MVEWLRSGIDVNFGATAPLGQLSYFAPSDTSRLFNSLPLVQEYFGQAGSGGFEQIDIMEDRIELIKDILHLLPEHYEYTGPKFKASASSVPPTPAVAAAEEKGKLASLPELPASAAAQVQAQAPPTPVVAEYVN